MKYEYPYLVGHTAYKGMNRPTYCRTQACAVSELRARGMSRTNALALVRRAREYRGGAFGDIDRYVVEVHYFA